MGGTPRAVCRRGAVAGDLNMNRGGRHHYGTRKGRDLLEEGLARAGLACVTTMEHVPAGKLTAPHVDHIFLSRSWSQRAGVVEAWPGTINGVRLSDHSVLVVAVQPVM